MNPLKAHNNTNYSWCATVSNCSNVSSYLWEYSTDGFNYNYWSSFPCNVSTMPQNQDLYLRVTATCSNNRTAIDFFVTQNLDAPNLATNHTPSFRPQEINLNIFKDFDVLVSPNPVSDHKLTYTLKLPEEGRVSVVLMDQLGRNIYTISGGKFQKGSINISKVLPNLSTRMYFLRAIWEDQSIIKKVIIQ